MYDLEKKKRCMIYTISSSFHNFFFTSRRFLGLANRIPILIIKTESHSLHLIPRFKPVYKLRTLSLNGEAMTLWERTLVPYEICILLTLLLDFPKEIYVHLLENVQREKGNNQKFLELLYKWLWPIVFGEDTKYYCYPPVVYCCYVIYCYTTVTHRVYGGQLINGVSAQVYLTVGPVGSLNQPVVT